jgi:hypothetical protein
MSFLVAAAAAAAVALCGGTVLAHAGQDVYAIPDWGRTLTMVLLALGVAGAAVVAWARQAQHSAAVLVIAALGVFGLLAIFSVGIVVLAVAAGLLALTLGRDWTGPRRGAAAAGAVLAGGVLPLLLLLALSDPVVDCGPEGTRAGENLFMALGGDETASAAMDSPDGGIETGGSRGENYEYDFTCRDGRLVEFDLRWR